ncbi:putative cell wall glycosyl hydrolase protein [Neofusicoccum parvum UCRNP2]|uniref:Putative cell wall glycosyl hydrolase protein n=1 Tax=Botryosphaeria parva (strain UCR-NP2) TaxID=1287680 RepID=R1EUF4_BOTPV|nr:putative cell wall glycosyl hydrolase protein [Neofusicoccum parvum UCRNP2]
MKASLSFAAAALTTAAACQDSRPYSTWMSDSFMLKDIEPDNHYTNAVLYRAVDLVYKASGNETYFSWIKEQVDAVVSDNGTIAGWPADKDSLDDILLGRNLLELYGQTNETKYKTAATNLRLSLDKHKRTPAGGFWHRDPTYPNQMWLDGIYMADVFYAQYTAAFEPANTTAWDDVLLQFSLIEQHLRNATSNLLYHGYDELKAAVWADPVTGASPHVWNRALGWYVMALLDALDYFPADHAGHQQLRDWYVAAADGVVAAQDPETGGWWLVMDEPYPGMAGNYIESSGTAMFTYGLLKGARLGYVAGEKYTAPAEKAYQLMVNEFVAQNATGGMLNWEGTVEVGSLSGNASYEYYIGVPLAENDLKGAGPFIYASLEYEAFKA